MKTDKQKNISCKDIENLFNKVFYSKYNTILVGGYDEPIYIASGSKHQSNEIRYREDFVSSALHEVAHWCIAGSQRRKLNDYGYWYSPDGRSAKQQLEFEKVEVKPQAIEYAFSIACGLRFSVSLDNINGNLDSLARVRFSKQVDAQLRSYQNTSFPSRASLFIDELSKRYQLVPN